MYTLVITRTEASPPPRRYQSIPSWLVAIFLALGPRGFTADPL